MNNGNILIIDDEESLRGLIDQILELEGYKVFDAATALDGLSLLTREDIQVVISDVVLPDINGIELISRIKEINRICEIIIITAYGTIPDGVKAIKEGAFDYITKGDEDNRLVPLVEKAMDKVQLKTKIASLEKRIEEKYSFENIVAQSAIMKDTVAFAMKIALTDVPVLLLGETGTGKEIFAQAIHNSGKRKNNHFVAVNCSAFAKDLLESEMFGYKAGAFTGATKNKKGLFEEAHEGTLFLDEIGDLDIGLQAKLLRVLENSSFIKQGDTKPTTVDVRIIAATNRNLEEEISKGNFRKDLYYRLSVVKLEIPSLKERKEDILPLAKYFISLYSAKLKKNIIDTDPEFIEKLIQYDFPGNIRELRNIIERAMIINEGSKLSPNCLPKEILQGNIPGDPSSGRQLTLEDYEKKHIADALRAADGNKQRAAEILGIGLTTLYRKIQQYGI